MEIIEGRIDYSNPKVPSAKKFFYTNYKKNSKINITKTALSLGVSRQTLHNWIKDINS